MGIDSSEVAHLRADLALAPARVEVSAVDAVGDFVSSTERDAKAFAPVFSGELKSRIRGLRLGLGGTVESGAPYSGYVEDGTSDTAPQPFMRPAIERNLPRLEDHLGDAGESVL